MPVEIKRQVKFVTKQRIIAEPEEEGGYPMRHWTISLFLVSDSGDSVPATCFEKVTYKLHESFGKKATQVLRNPPFTIAEEGWGEFEMLVTLTPLGNPKGGEQALIHDLNFAQDEYDSLHTVSFRNPKDALLDRLRESGPTPENGNAAAAAAAAGKKKTKGARAVDMEKLAAAMERLGEDDLLHVVQLVHDNKSEDTYIKNDVENGEFHVDLYTLPDGLVKMLWDFVTGKVDIATL